MAILVYNPEFITYWQGHSFAIEAPAEFSVEKNAGGTSLCKVVVEDAFNTIGTFDVLADGTSIGEVNTVSGLDTVIGKEHPILFDDTLTITQTEDIIDYGFISDNTTYTSIHFNSANQTISYSDGTTTTIAYDGAQASETQSGWQKEAYKYIAPQSPLEDPFYQFLVIARHYGTFCEYCLPIDVSTLSGWNNLSDGFHRVQFKYKEANTKYLVISPNQVPGRTIYDVSDPISYLFDSVSDEFRYGIGYMVVVSGASVVIDITNASAEGINACEIQLAENNVPYKEYNHPKTKISSEVLVGKNTVFQPHVITQTSYLVSDVVDGDTIKVDFGSGVIQKVRLIGVDTPESVATGTMADKNCPEGVYVSNLTKQLKNTYVYLEFDEEIYDQFNRYLAYVHLDNAGNNMYNNNIVSNGYAKAIFYAPNGYHRTLLETSMATASTNHTGFWGTSIQYPGYAFYPEKIPAITDLTINDGIITWPKSVWASSYKIHVGSQDLAIVNQPASGNTVSYDLYDLGLTAGQTYNVKVRAIAAHRHHEDSNLGNQVQFTPVDYASIPLFFTSDQAFTAGYNKSSEITEIDIQYREGETGSWTSWNGTTLNIPANTKLYVKNNTNTLSTNGNYFNFSGNFKTVGGNLKYMLGESDTLPSYSFCKLFYAVTSMESARHLILPWSTVSGYCYNNMFSGCTSLIAGPRLPATTLAVQCYGNMFNGCTALTSSPALPVTTLVGSCYRSMFNGCTSLQTAPSLPATTLAQSCYQSMFYGCTSLQTCPALPATTLAQSCYQSMFYGCTSLQTCPALPATTLAAACYLQMFYDCTSLTTCPALPATGNAAAQCYQKMFYGCTSLTQLPALPLTLVSAASYSDMFYGCSNIKLSTTQTGEYVNAYRIPTTGKGTTATEALLNMFYNTGGTFKGTPTINTTYYTSNTIVE